MSGYTDIVYCSSGAQLVIKDFFHKIIRILLNINASILIPATIPTSFSLKYVASTDQASIFFETYQC